MWLTCLGHLYDNVSVGALTDDSLVVTFGTLSSGLNWVVTHWIAPCCAFASAFLRDKTNTAREICEIPADCQEAHSSAVYCGSIFTTYFKGRVARHRTAHMLHDRPYDQ